MMWPPMLNVHPKNKLVNFDIISYITKILVDEDTDLIHNKHEFLVHLHSLMQTHSKQHLRFSVNITTGELKEPTLSVIPVPVHT